MNPNPASEIIRHFQAFLEEAKLSRISIKNYLSDVRLFLASIRFKSIRDLNALTFQGYLEEARSTKPESTCRRYTASLRRFATFLLIEYRLELLLPSANSLESNARQPHNLINQFRLYLTREKKSAATVKNYLSDLNHFLTWTASNTPKSTNGSNRPELREILTQNTLTAYFDHLKLTHTSSSVSDRRTSTLRKLVQFSLDQQLISHNPFSTSTPLPQIATITLAPLPKNPIKRDQTTNPIQKLYHQYHTLSFTPYLHLAILILATTTLGIFGYNQVFEDTKPSQAYPTSLTRPTRQLSFQGRLTDNDGNAITSPTSVIFRLYPVDQDGSPVYEATNCTVAPDEDGIFSTQIGNGNCGVEIGSEVFSENASLFLEVAIGGQTLTPRQPIATSGYALNSETLQGYPASASATENTVPVVNNDGTIVLGASSPTLLAENGTFAIKGQAVTLATLPGTDGDISVAPDGRGSVNLIGGLDKGIFVNVTDANLTTGTLIEGYVANNGRTGTLLHLASGTKQVNRLTIYTTGQTDIIADTYTKPAFSIKQTGTGPIFSAKVGNTLVGELNSGGDLGLLGGLSLGSPINTNPLPGQLLVNANSQGQAALIVNQNDLGGDLFTASQSGRTVFVISNEGHIGIGGSPKPPYTLTVNGITATSRLQVAETAVNGYVLTSDANGFGTWQAPTGGGSGGWTLAAPIIYPNLTTYQVVIGADATASALGKFTVYGDVASAPVAYLSGSTTAAALIIDNLGSGNLINASSSGTNKFTVANDGDITSSAIAVAGGVVWTDVTGNLNSVAGTAGQCLTSGGAATPVWTACAGADSWQRNDGALSPSNISDSVNIGAVATASAFNHFGGTPGENSFVSIGASFGINTRTPGETLDVVGNATVSGNLTFYGGARTIASRLNTTLTIGDTQTGNIIIAPGGTTAITAIGNDVTLADTLTINGSSVTLAGNDTIVDMTGTGTLSLNTVTNRAITTGTGQITLAGNVDATNGLDVTTANLTVGGANFTVAPASGDVTTAGDIAVNGGDLTTSATTFNLINTTATTLNIGGAAATMNLGPGGATAASLNFVGGSGATGCTVDGATGNFTCSGAISTTATTGIQGWWQRNSGALSPTNLTDDILLGSTATTSARIALFNVADGTPTASLSAGLAGATYLTATGNLQTTSNQSLTIGGATTGNITLSPLNGVTAAYVVPNTDNQVDLGLASLRWRNVYAGTITGTLNPGFTEGSVVFIGPSGLAQDNANFFYNDSTNQLGLGTTSPLARLDARASNGITPTASISGATSFATLVVDNSGVGDIFTASSSGLNRFVITQAGNVGIGTTTPAYLLDVQGGTGVQVATFSGRVAGDLAVNANDFVTLSQVGTGGGGPWTRLAPNVYLTTNTDKVGIGTAAPSGKFQVANDVGTTPAASISATSSFAALVVDNSGVGDIFTASASGLNRFVITSAGNVGIGTTAPDAALEINNAIGDSLRLTYNDADGGAAAYTDFSLASDGALTIESAGNNISLGTSDLFTIPGVEGSNSLTITAGDGVISDGSLLITDDDDAVSFGVTNNTATTIGAGINTAGVVDISSTSLTTGNLVNLETTTTLTTGRVLNISSTSTALANTTTGSLLNMTASGNPAASWTGSLGLIEYTTSTDADVDGSALRLGITGAGTGEGSVLNITTAQTGATALALRVNDDGTYTDSTAFVIDNAGNAGIGTTTPVEKLDLVGNATVSGNLTFYGGARTIASRLNTTLTIGDTQTGNIVMSPQGGAVASSVTPSTDNQVDLGTASLRWRNIYGTLNPSFTEGSVVFIDSTGKLAQDNTNFFWNDSTNRLGLGTASPLASLDARATLGTAPAASISGATSFATLVIDQSGVGDIFTASASGLNRFVITNAGNVGINTTLPTEALDIVGNATISGNLTFYGGARTIASRLKTSLTLGDSQTGHITLSPHGGVLGAYVAPNTDAQVDLGQSTLRWRNVYAENVIATGISGSIQGFWQRTTGSLQPAFLSDDVLTGSISTTSAYVKLTGTAGNPSFINTGSFGVGTTTTLATTDLRSMLGTVAVASVSGATSMAALVVDNSGVGDLFTASSSGLNRFVITQAGNVGIGTTVPATNLEIYESAGSIVEQLRLNNPSDAGAAGSSIGFRQGSLTSDAAEIRSGFNTAFYLAFEAGSSEIMRLESNRVGIGTGTILPLATTDIRAMLGTIPTASISGATSIATLMVDNSLNYDIIAASSSGARRLRLETTGDLTLYGSSGVAAPPTGRVMPGFDSVQDIGATAQQWKSIYLSNAIQNGATVSINLATQHFGDNGAGRWTFDNDASVSGNLNVVGTTWLGCNVAAPPGCGNPLTSVMIAGVDGTGKIDVGTVDPPYTINGEKYATYLPGMVGQNEEVTGNIQTTELVTNVGYRTTIDFSNVEKASNLWLFSKVTDLTKHIRDMAVILTPGQAARAWYVLEPEKMLLHIYTSRPTTVSYRFTAPRFDSDKWINTRPIDGIAGFIVTDPDLPLNNLAQNGPIVLDPTFTETNVNEYTLSLGDNPITEIGSYASLLVANLKTGFINTQRLIAQTASFNLLNTDKLVSPVAEIETLRVSGKLLSPLAEIAEIKAGTVSAENVAAAEATISGTLYATDINSPVIDSLNSKYDLLSSDYATASSILAAIKAKYDSFESLNNPTIDPLVNELDPENATISGEYALYNQPIIITDSLLVNTTLVSNSLNSAEGTLYLQPTASAPINLLAGVMILSPDGQVNLNGDLTISGTLYANNVDSNQTTTNQLNTNLATISGQLVLGKEAPPSANNLVSLFNEDGDLVSTINASGAASFKELATSGLIIANAATQSATASSSGTFNTNATIGTATIFAGETEITITNSNIRANTYIYLTPISDTNNQVLYIKAKEEGVGATIAINQPLTTNVTFNYWLIQSQP